MRRHALRKVPLVLFLSVGIACFAADPTLAELITAVRAKAKALERSSGTQRGFQSFLSAHQLDPGSVSYSDYALVRLLFEASRDAGFWNLHWVITNLPPNSDNIWRQWKGARAPSPLAPTAMAECDELSALYAFLAGRAGVRGVGLFWPAANHTVAVWAFRPSRGPAVRVVVPTTQIFLSEADFFGTRRFDPWRQKSIYEYTRRDIPDSFELPKPLYDYFLRQVDKYAGASDAALQRLRYLREAVFLKTMTPETAAGEALRATRNAASPREDLAAFQQFARDIHPETDRR